MKKLFILSFVLIASAVTLSSCQKDYTCTCTTTYAGGSSSTSSATINDTYPKAKKSCNAGAYSNTTTQEVRTCRIE